MQGREMKAVEEDKQEKRYTWRHRWKQDDEYQVFARSRSEAMKIAIERLGCIGCPMAGKREREREFAHWTKFKEQWIRTFQRMVDKRIADGLPTDWTDGKQVFDFWMEDKR